MSILTALPHLLPGRTPRSLRVKRETVDSFLRFTRGGPAPAYPAEVYLEVSNVCDLRCVMCPRFSAFNPDRKTGIRETDPGFVDSDPATESLRPILEHALAVHVFGYGEPTIHPDFSNLLSHVAQFDVLIDFFTNGMHLTDELARQVVELSIYRITLSFSGATRDAYESVYQGGEFDRVLEGLDRLKRRKQEAGRRYPQLHVNSLSFEHHVRELDRFVDLMADHGADAVEVTRLLEHGAMLPALTGHAANLRSSANRSAVERAKRRAAERGVQLSIHDSLEEELARGPVEAPGPAALPAVPLESFRAFASGLPVRPPRGEGGRIAVLDLDRDGPDQIRQRLRIRSVPPDSNGEFFACMEPFKTLYVRRGGQVKPCCYSADDAPALGHVERWSAQKIWNGAGFAAVRAAIANGEYPLATCGSCVKNGQAPATHGVGRMISEYAIWRYDQGGDALDRGSLAELARAGDGRTILERAWETDPSHVQFPGTAERVERLLQLVADVPSVSVLEGRLLEGWIDQLTAEEVAGWVWAPGIPDIRIPLRVYRNGTLVATPIARRFRVDLAAAGKGDGCYAFYVRFDSALQADESVSVRLGNTRCEIGANPHVADSRENARPALLRTGN